MSGIACFVTSTNPNTLVSKIVRHASAGITSSGRLSLSTPALLTSTRKPAGRFIVDASFTSSRSTRIAAGVTDLVGEARAVGRVAHRSRPRRSRGARARSRPRARSPAPHRSPPRLPFGFHAARAYERGFGTVPPLGPALHSRAGALPRRRARVARRPARRTVRARCAVAADPATSTSASTNAGRGSRSSAATAGSASAGRPSTAAAARRSSSR